VRIVVASVSEVIFHPLILLANTAAFFCDLLGLDSHSFREGNSGEKINRRWGCFAKINHLRDSWLVLINDGLQNRLFMPAAPSWVVS